VEIADVDAEAPTAPGSGVTLRGPIAAEFIAPLPPRKPQDVIALAYADMPLPPTRPAEFAAAKYLEPVVAPANSGSADAATPRPPEFVVEPTAPTSSQGNRDMILALLKRGQLPDVITRGLKPPPREALALTETGAPEPPERPALIAKAAALSAPLPPPRPARSSGDREAEETRAARAAPTPPLPAQRPKGLSANPFGALTVQAFGDDPQTSVPADRLRARAIAAN
jgi:hypothetical protein